MHLPASTSAGLTATGNFIHLAGTCQGFDGTYNRSKKDVLMAECCPRDAKPVAMVAKLVATDEKWGATDKKWGATDAKQASTDEKLIATMAKLISTVAKWLAAIAKLLPKVGKWILPGTRRE